MAEAVTARWHGDNYQARIFWENAFNLLVDGSCVVEVTFEANGPKAFDDVIVKYAPPIPGSGSGRVDADYHQVKWHVERGGRFGYEDFTDPDFIGAKSFSLLQRLRDARAKAGPGARFTFLTTYGIKDDDPLAGFISGTDRSLLIERLFDGTTDRSRTGKVRKLWREHLSFSGDDELKEAVSGLRVIDNYRSLDELRSEINIRATAVGLLACSASDSDFRYDELARQFKVQGLNALTRETLRKICQDEGLIGSAVAPDPSLPVAIRSFLGPAADIVGASPENTLLLTEEFRQRYLAEDRDWQRDVRPKVEAFLREAVKKSAHLRLILDAHASIAFLAGKILDLKSGVHAHIVQKGRVGAQVWRADDRSGQNAPRFETSEVSVGAGREIALAIGIARSVMAQTSDYVAAALSEVGKIISYTLPSGPGQRTVHGGEHAAVLAEQIANHVRTYRDRDRDRDVLVHIFAAAPNALLFYLGQHHQAIAPCVVYEYDFDRQGNRTYQPSFVID